MKTNGKEQISESATDWLKRVVECHEKGHKGPLSKGGECISSGTEFGTCTYCHMPYERPISSYRWREISREMNEPLI